uniref:Uncharacterized protein n=1 Tax=Sphaerodactylus townsendi TaxID=933632 RepID=A0ACB8EMI2_9SAUR
MPEDATPPPALPPGFPAPPPEPLYSFPQAGREPGSGRDKETLRVPASSRRRVPLRLGAQKMGADASSDTGAAAGSGETTSRRQTPPSLHAVSSGSACSWEALWARLWPSRSRCIWHDSSPPTTTWADSRKPSHTDSTDILAGGSLKSSLWSQPAGWGKAR